MKAGDHQRRTWWIALSFPAEHLSWWTGDDIKLVLISHLVESHTLKLLSVYFQLGKWKLSARDSWMRPKLGLAAHIHCPETLSIGAYGRFNFESGRKTFYLPCNVLNCVLFSCVVSLQQKMIPARPTRACMVGAVWPRGRDTVAFALRAIQERAARSVSGLRERSGSGQNRSRPFEGVHISSGSALEFMQRAKIGYKTTASSGGYSFDPWCRTNEYDY